MWLFARALGSHGDQPVPSIGGFISATGDPPTRKTTIDYYPPIDEPITEYSTVAELLRRSEQATAEVGQEYIINTFDLGVCMKALPLIWCDPLRYSKHIVLIGQFHTAMNFISMLFNHKMKRSGYQELLVEAQLVTTGCLNGILNGKAYAKALFYVKTVSAALERLLLDSFLQEEGQTIDMEPQVVLSLVTNCDKEHLDIALGDASVLQLLKRIQDYESKVQDGHLGKTAMLWYSFIEHSRLLMMLLFAVKTNNVFLFHKCMGDMADLLFAFGGQNYAR